ncbi:MAG: PAS domain S-box protein [Candidatus Thermoplasmatota archaeon]
MQKYSDVSPYEKTTILDTTTSDGRYKTLFEQVNAAAFLTTFDGQILEANQKSCELFGYQWNELLRLSLRDLLPKETDWIQFKDEIAARGGNNFEVEVVTKDGSFIPTEISISLFRLENKPAMFVLIWDITERRNAERRLRESEKKYHGLFEFTTDGILVLDARGDILDVNTKMCEMLDYSKEELINKNLFSMDFLTPQSLPVVVNQFEQLLSEKTARSYTSQMKNRHNEILDVEFSSFFLVKKNNEVDNFVLIARDITSRNEFERRRIREHELLLTLMDNIPDSVYFKDNQNRFILVNKAKAMHSSVTPDQMIGKTDFDFLPKEQAEKIQQDDLKILQTGQPIINKIEKLSYPDGSDRWVSVTKIPRYNIDGDIIGTMGISRDITALEKAKEELMKSEQRYRAVFENSSVAILLTDEQGRIVSWNKLVEDILGMNYTDLFMRKVESLYPLDEWEHIHTEYLQKQGAKRRIETKILRKDRRLVDVDLSVNVLRDANGQILGSTEIISDITKHKETERALEHHHELLSILMDNIPDSIYFKDEQLRFIAVNRAKALHSKVTPAEMIGKTDFDFLPTEQAEKIQQDEIHIMQTGQALINKIEKITHSDGINRWVSVTKIPRFNKNGKIIGIMGISRDITDLQEAEEKIRKEHNLLQELMDTIPDSIYFKDEQNRFILVNKTKASHWNVTPDEMIGKTDFDFLPHAEAQKAFDDDNYVLKTGHAIIDKIEHITGSDGLERWFSVTKVPRYNEKGQIIGTIGISRNVTQWKKLEGMKKEQLC